MRYGHERECLECGRTLVLDALKPGWTPLPQRGGWACPDCSRRLAFFDLASASRQRSPN
jgi:DNA-directed RNA polymerase subunit RPC12/RpoP